MKTFSKLDIFMNLHKCKQRTGKLRPSKANAFPFSLSVMIVISYSIFMTGFPLLQLYC